MCNYLSGTKIQRFRIENVKCKIGTMFQVKIVKCKLALTGWILIGYTLDRFDSTSAPT
jgi:hypothetical protein